MSLFCARRWGYNYGDVPLDREQVIALQGYENDEKLVRLGYLVPLADKLALSNLCTCGVCGAQFLTPSALNAHGSKRHPERGESRIIRDADGRMPDGMAVLAPPGVDPEEAELRLQDSMAPIYWDQTKASRASGEGVPHITTKAKPKKDAPKRKRGRPRKTATA